MHYTARVFEANVDGKVISIETGRLAKQSSGAVLVKCGGTAVLVTVVADSKPKSGVDFLPLACHYTEQAYAAGKIPGGFFKREGKPSEKEVLTSRLLDRPIRPLFPEGWYYETQVIALVLSADGENDPDVLAMVGTSASIALSDIPFTPIGAVRVGRVDGKFVANPTKTELATSDLNIVVAASKDSMVMVEGGAKFVAESVVLDALEFGHKALQPLIALQEKMQAEHGKPKRKHEAPKHDAALLESIRSFAEPLIRDAVAIADKQERYARLDAIHGETSAKFAGTPETAELGDKVDAIFEEVKWQTVRKIMKTGKRIDGRGLKDIRPISCEVTVLERTHGSALFTRGETQALVVSTLGTSDDEQRIDSLEGDIRKRFMLHYNFPPFSVGEVRRYGIPGRREIGHGALAERSIRPTLPDDLAYTIRIVSDIFESNGSSSMASVCGASMSLMDAGIKIKAPVAGIAMGLVKEDDQFMVLSDILGDEDHLGDMDFKVCGSKDGITGLQMDIKVQGLSREIMKQALDQAREGRLHILGKMAEAIAAPRADLSPYAPRLTTIKINPDRIRDVIGSGGKTIRGIVAETGCKIDVEDDGSVTIFSSNAENMARAVKIIKNLTEEAEVGAIYIGKVRKIMDFGAFVEILPGTDGLVHISQIANERVERVSDVLKEGDQLLVRVLGIDPSGKIKLSRKDALDAKPEQAVNR
jgi:polyribonucleotide nucleotidyltransferase